MKELNITLVQHRKHKNTKKLTPQIEDLPTEFPDVEFVKFMERTIKTSRPTKVRLNGSDMDKEWAWFVFPKWKDIWEKKGVKMKYDERQHCIFMNYSKELADAYKNFLKLTR